MRNLRNLTWQVPPWLEDDPLCWAMRLQQDALLEQLRYCIWSHFPGYYSDDTLDKIGRERGLPRGVGEPNKGYAARLIGWIEAHRLAGTATGYLSQLCAMLSVYLPGLHAKVIEGTGMTHEVLSGGAISHHGGPAWNWDGQALPYRWWTILFVDHPDFAARIWGDPNAIWGDGGRWGAADGQDILASLRQLALDWGSANSEQNCTIICPSLQAYEDIAPDGTWDKWYGRDAANLYIDGTAT